MNHQKWSNKNKKSLKNNKVETLLQNLDRYNELVIHKDKKNWISVLKRIEQAIKKQGVPYQLSQTDEGDVWIYILH